MKKTRNLIVLLALVAVMVAAMVVSTSAYISWDEETGTFPGGNKSAYADVNTSGWVQIGRNAGVVNNGSTDTLDEEGDLYGSGGNWLAFYNATTKTVVLETKTDGLSLSTWSGAENTKTNTAYWIKQNAASIEHIEIRNAGSVSSLTYIIGSLVNVKTIKIGTSVETLSYHSHFKGMSSLETVKWGTWSKDTGAFTAAYDVEDGTIDLRGFKYVTPSTSIWLDKNHSLVLPSFIQTTAAKKVILPAQQIAPETANINRVVTATYAGEYVQSWPSAKEFSKGARAYVLQDADGNIYYSERNTSLQTGWSKVEDKAVDTAPHYGDYTGIIPWGFAKGATNLEEVIVPADVVLKEIEPSAFDGCTALELIDIKGSVSADMKVTKNAFTNVSDLVIRVVDEISKANMEAALSAAGVANVTVVAEQEQSDLENAVVSEGFSVRMKDYTGLRALFSFDLDVEAANNANGYTLVSYGVFATSYKNFIEIYNGNEDILFAYAKTIEDNTGSAVKYVPVYNLDCETGENTGANRYVDYATRTFCISLTNISSANALADIFMAGYAIWQDENGNEYYTITTYDMADGEKAVNLYEITLGLTKNGIINSENTEDVCFWQTLKVGALKTNEFSEIPETTATGYALSADGYFEYLDVDWHAYTGATTTGYSFNPTGVDTQASGVVWSVLKYTDDEYVLIIRNKDRSTYTELSIPQYAPGDTQYRFYAPYDYRYGSNEKILANTSLTAYNPALTQNDYNKIKTMVVDHGITGTAAYGFAGLTSVETIVYPNGLSGRYDYKFIGSTSVKNVIWCHTDSEGNPVNHVSEFKSLISVDDNGNVTKQPLFDLRGMKQIAYTALLQKCSSVENVVLPTAMFASNVQAVFSNTPALKRVWAEGDAVPDIGVVDLSRISIVKVQQEVFNFGSSTIHTVKLPSTVTTISGTKALGNGLSINFFCNDAVKDLIVAYAKGTYASQVANIAVNDTPISDLIG